MSNTRETPAIMQPGDPELQQAAEAALGSTYTVEEGDIHNNQGGTAINPNFNKGVPLGPWVAPGEGRKYGYTENLTDVEADSAAEDKEKARRIGVNAYPISPVGEARIVEDALRARAQQVYTDKRT